MSIAEQMLWVEKYRPQTIDECILPEVTKNMFKEFVGRGELPNFLFAGSAGVGKTTIARALCNEIGADVLFINCSEESGIDTLRNKIRSFASTVSLTNSKKVVILDEFDYANCLEESELILLSNGSYKKIADLSDNDLVMSLNLETKVFEEKPARILSTKESEVYKVTLEDGSTVMVTEDHPFIVEVNGGLEQATVKTGLMDKHVVKMY